MLNHIKNNAFNYALIAIVATALVTLAIYNNDIAVAICNYFRF